MTKPVYPSYAWGYIFGVPALAATLECFLVRRDLTILPRVGEPRVVVAAGLLVGAILAGLFPVRLARNQKMNLGTTAEFAAVLLLPASVAAAIATVATLLYSAAMRRSWFNVLFSGGQHALVVGSAALVYGALWSPDLPPLTAFPAAVAVAAAGIVHVVVAVTVLSGVIAATQRRFLLWCMLDLTRQSGAQYAALIGDGALIAVCVWQAPWAIPLPALALPLIHEFNQTLEKLAIAKEEVDATLVRQRQFVTDIAHEIGTPLTTLRGNLDVLRRGTEGDRFEARDVLEDVGSEFNRLASAFTRLLLLAEADEKDQIAREPVSLDAVLEDLVDVWQQRAQQHGLTLGLTPTAPTLVTGDPLRLRQMFGELLENATRYTPPGGRIVVELQRATGLARVVVTDSGVGIDPDDLPRIFDRFYRGTSSRLVSGGRPTTGSGLGLAIVRWVAESHGGRVLVDAAPGKGSRFTVELPLSMSGSSRA